MGRIYKPHPVKLIIGFIFKGPENYLKANSILTKTFGRIDFESPLIPFKYTDYYEKEVGQGLQRKFVSFHKLISPDKLAQIKILTNSIEDNLSANSRRSINIDPGYLDMAKLLLASTKDYAHRIYLNKGIFAEITLFYQGRTFRPWEWTYPDYRTEEYIDVFNKIRDIYAKQVKNT
jgi:hypothetical protein